MGSVNPHFIVALVAFVVSEVIPIVTKSRYGGIVHALVALLGKLYSSPGDIDGLTAQVAILKSQIEKIKEPPVAAPQAKPASAPVLNPPQQAPGSVPNA